MEFDSAQFALFALLACAILRFEISQDLRVIAIACLNVLFLASFVPSLLSVVPLVGFAALGYIIVLLAACLSTRSLIVLGFVFVVLFIWLKGYTIVAFVPALHFPITDGVVCDEARWILTPK